MNEEAKKRLYLYSTIGISILIIATLVAVFVGMGNNRPGDTYQPPITEKPDGDNDDDSDDTVVVQDVKFQLPIKGEYNVFRHYWHVDLTNEEKEMAIVNSKTTDGVTLTAKNKAEFDVYAPIPGEVIEVSTGDRGVYLAIKTDNVIVELHSIKDVIVTVGTKVEVGQRLAKSSTNALDEEAGSNVYLITKVKDSSSFKRSNPLNYVNKKISEITYVK